MELIYVNEVLENATEYMRRRVSDKVLITTHLPSDAEGAMVCLSLFEWVIENLCKNAVDAMNGEGRIDVYMTSEKQQIYIDIKDTGKGLHGKISKRFLIRGTRPRNEVGALDLLWQNVL